MLSANVDLIKGRILKSLIIFAIPIFVSNLFQQLYNTVDVTIVGHYLGDTSLAAIGACTAVYEMLVGFSLGVGNGFCMVTARSFGARDEKMVKKSVAASLVIGVGLTVFIMLISKLFLLPLLRVLKTPDNIIDEAYSYVSIVTMFVGVMFLYNLAAGVLRAIGNSFMPLVFLVVSSLLNIVLDILFIVEFKMGIRGAAIATVIAQGISGIMCIIYICVKCKILVPRKEHFKFDGALYKDLIGQGLSMGLMSMVVSAGTVILQRSINGLGYLIIAGHTTARKISSVSYMPLISLATSLATFVSQNKGANEPVRIRKAVKYANILAVIWGVVVTVVLIFFSSAFARILSGSSENEVIDYATKYMIFNSSFYPVFGILFNLRNSLQGLGEKILPLISSVIEFVGKIIFVILFIPILKEWGVIICEPIIWCFMCAQLAYSFYRSSSIEIVSE